MKKLFIAALLFVGMASFAQNADENPPREQRERLTPEQRNEKQLQRMTTQLNLDANQQAQMKQLLAERSAQSEKLRASRKDRQNSTTKLTADERAAFKKQMLDEQQANEAKMKSILNADQYQKWTTIQAQNREKAKERMKDWPQQDQN
jgi:protein CpxP